MIHNLISTKEYKDLTTKQIKEILVFLVDQKVDFSLTANIDGVIFTPEIPNSIKKYFTKFTLFSLANYTLQSLELHENYLTFEAGFGSENFGSVCQVPYYAIFQISIENSILFLNPTATLEKYFMSKEEEEKQMEKSRKAFKLNR
jgi:hypothetical protein